MIRRKIAVELLIEDFKLIDQHCALREITKQDFLERLLAPALDCLRPIDPFESRHRASGEDRTDLN